MSCPFPTYFFIIVFDFKPEQKISLLLVLCAGGLTTYPLLSVPIAGKFSACASNLDTHKHKHHPCQVPTQLGPGLNFTRKVGSTIFGSYFSH